MDVQRLTPGVPPAERPAGPTPPAHAPGRSFGDVLAGAAGAPGAAGVPAPPPGPAAPGAPGPLTAADLFAGPPDTRAPQAQAATGADQPLVVVRRHGAEYHVYGRGKDRQVFEVPQDR